MARPGAWVIVGAISLVASRASGAPEEHCSTAECHADASKLKPHVELLSKHAGVDLGCTGCHAGNAAAQEKEKAHATSGPTQLLSGPNTAASCSACHIVGAVAGTDLLVDGARVYQTLGCQLCHPALGYGFRKTFAPPLDAAGFRGTGYLTQVVHHPESIYQGTVMPAFEHPLATLGKDRERALFAFLLSFRGEPRPTTRSRSDQRCATCHAQKKPATDGFDKHRCRWIKEAKAEIQCARCHKDGVPTSDQECLFIARKKSDCGTCHTLGGGHE
jgi:hypothetical protein